MTFTVLHEVDYDMIRSLMDGVCCMVAGGNQASISMASDYAGLKRKMPLVTSE